ncbi:metallophosphoesterase [Thermodesulfobacteriota bacterium]
MDSQSENFQKRNNVIKGSPYIQPLSRDKGFIDRRQIWAANRFWMEVVSMKTRRYGFRGRHHWNELLFMMRLFKGMLQLTGLYKKGVRNAEDIKLKENVLYFSNLPEAFEDFTILHLSDLHLDGMKGLSKRILSVLDNREVDLCVLTGDYRNAMHGFHEQIMEDLGSLISRIRSRQGFLGILGNHDSCHIVNPMERLGIHMLINGNCYVQKGNDRILFIGTDDVHYYYTDQALHALEGADSDFCIALIHSPELYDMAAQMGVDLYLCGHTHSGQVCLPGGRAIIKHLNRGRKYYRGHWCFQKMQGVTHSGTGTSGIPVRFNTQGEVLIHHLRRG